MLKDEQQALQLEFVCLQDKFTKSERNYNELVERLGPFISVRVIILLFLSKLYFISDAYFYDWQ